MRSYRIVPLALSALLLAATSAAADPKKFDPHVARLVEENRGDFAGGAFAPAHKKGADLHADVFIDADAASLAAIKALGVNVRTVLPNGLMTADAPVKKLNALAAIGGVKRIESARRVNMFMDRATGPIGLNAPVQGTNEHRTGQGVIVGVIDTGIDWKHPDFAGRILKVWDHTIDPAETSGAASSPTGYSYGTVWTTSHFANPATCLTKDTDGHGTHVAGTAAGSGAQSQGAALRGVAYEAQLIVVKFDFDNVKDRNTSASIIDAAAWIFAEAAAAGKPCVINMSLGSDYGPHDGTTAEERGLDALTGEGKVLCVAAGNAGRSYSSANLALWGPPLHGAGRIDGNTDDITVDVPAGYAAGPAGGDDYTFIDLWYKGTDRCRVQITSPSGAKYPPSFNGAYRNLWTTGGQAGGFSTPEGLVYVSNKLGSDNGWDTNSPDNNIYIEISDGGSNGAALASGRWKIDLIQVSGTGDFHAWNGNSSNLNLARFKYEGADSDNVMTIGAPATAKKVISIGAYMTKDSWPARQYANPSDPLSSFTIVTQSYGTAPISYYDPMAVGGLAFFSSRGPSRDGRTQPAISAPGVGIVACLSQDALDAPGPNYYRSTNRVSPDGFYATLQGTSMATPCATGAIALLLQQALATSAPRTPAAISGWLGAGARRDADTGAAANNDWGAGKIDVAQTLPLVIAPPPPPADTVTVSKALYTKSKKSLEVEATTTAGATATLTATWKSSSGAVLGSSPMTWDAATARYKLKVTVTTAPATVTVTSSGGGSATRTVDVK